MCVLCRLKPGFMVSLVLAVATDLGDRVGSTMVKIIPLRSTTLEKSGSGVPPSFCRVSPRDMVRLQ